MSNNNNSNNNDNVDDTTPSASVDIAKTLIKIRQARDAVTDIRKKYEASADREVDEDKKEFYEAIGAICFNLDSIWAETRMLYAAVGQSQLRSNMLHDAITRLGDMRLVAYMAIKDRELNDHINRLLKEFS
jgi:hypothetical protein